MTTPYIAFGSNALAIKDDVAFTMNLGSLQSFSSLNDLKSDGSVVNNVAYATYEQDFWLLDGNYHFLPTGSANVGMMTTNMSGADTHYAGGAQPELLITFDMVYSTSGLTLHFSDFTGDYTDQIEIVFYNSSDVTISDVTYHPTGSVFQTNTAISNFKKILFKFQSASKAYRYARLQRIDFDTITEFSGMDIRDAHLIEQINPLSVELPVNTLDFTLYSATGSFSLTNPQGVYASLYYKQPIDVHEDVNGLRLYIGRFYLDEWSSQSENLADFKASDGIGILDGQTYLGNLFVGGTVYSQDLINFIITGSGVGYSVDSSLQNIAVQGWFPVSSRREALQQIAFRLGAYVTCARSNVVNILPMGLASDLTDYDAVLGVSQKGLESPLSLKPYVTQVNLYSHNYVYDNGTGTYKGRVFYDDTSISSGTHNIFFDVLSQTKDFSGTATYTLPANSLFNVNYVEVDVTVAGSLKISHKSGFIHTTQENKQSIPTGTPIDNVVNITDAFLIMPPSTDNSASTTLTRVFNYYQQRFLQKTKLFASTIQVGDSVLIATQSNKQIKGFVEKMDTDLANGFVSNVDIVGVVA